MPKPEKVNGAELKVVKNVGTPRLAILADQVIKRYDAKYANRPVPKNSLSWIKTPEPKVRFIKK